jgi:hypothetical protein
MSIASRIPFDKSSSTGAGSFGTVGAQEGLGLALEVHLPVLVQPLPVVGHTGIEDGVEPVAVRPAQVERHEIGHLRRGIDLIPVERGF